jgi:hypothetical protein
MTRRFLRPAVSAWGAIVAELLPGDHIHYVAPINRTRDTKAMISAVDEARAKRARKNAKRLRDRQGWTR